MIVLNKIFAVIDPSTQNQRALIRAAKIAKIANAKIHAYLCIHSHMDTDDIDILKETEIARQQLWLDKLIEPLRADGVDIETQIDWNENWRSILGTAAKNANCELIVKSSRPHSTAERLFMSTSDMALFKTADCPVLLVKTEDFKEERNVLMAVDGKRDDEKYKKIFDSVVEFGKASSASYEDSELHVVHAYSNQDEYVHVTDLENRTRLETDRVHIVGDNPEQAIARVAKEIDAQMIIIGLSTKSTLVNRVFGSTAEWLLNNLDNDILVVIQGNS